MRLDRFIAKKRIIDLQSDTLAGAFDELLKACDLKSSEVGGLSRTALLKDLLSREQNMTTYLSNGIALPHLRIPMRRPYVFAVGRCAQGFSNEDRDIYKEVRYVFLLLASEGESSYLNVLSMLAGMFRDEGFSHRLQQAKRIEQFQDAVKRSFSGLGSEKATVPKDHYNEQLNRLMLSEARKIASTAGCSAVIVMGDTFKDGIRLGHKLSAFTTILVSDKTNVSVEPQTAVDAHITLKTISRTRLSQLRSALLIALSRGLIQYSDKICCLSGLAGSERLDTVVVIDVGREFQAVFRKQSEMLPAGVKPEILECVLAIATELAVEGREGQAVGSLFVIGDSAELKPYCKPLVLNPFYGYKDEELNILNPFMDETVKEFSTIDGAFIVRGDGVLESAGSLIHAPDCHVELPSGLGTRHAAAAAISMVADCIAVTVSSSTRQVTLFRRGQMLPLIDKQLPSIAHS